VFWSAAPSARSGCEQRRSITAAELKEQVEADRVVRAGWFGIEQNIFFLSRMLACSRTTATGFSCFGNANGFIQFNPLASRVPYGQSRTVNPVLRVFRRFRVRPALSQWCNLQRAISATCILHHRVCLRHRTGRWGEKRWVKLDENRQDADVKHRRPCRSLRDLRDEHCDW